MAMPPLTQEKLAAEFRRAGLHAGDRVMLHASLKAFGYVEGGAPTVIRALQQVLGEQGILAMPALSDTVDDETGTPFDPETTPIVSWIGVFPTVFWKMPGVFRSKNPTHSVLAWGASAREFLHQENPYDCFAPDGPWAKLRDSHGKILLVGNSVDSNTFLHACEAWYNGYLENVMVQVKGLPSQREIHFPGGCRGGWYHLGKAAPYFQRLTALGLVETVQVGLAEIVMMDAWELAGAMRRMFAENPGILLHSGGCRVCAKLRARAIALGD